MRAIDTNVVARYLLNDDPYQNDIAQRVFAEEVYLPITVLLETNWLLASRYQFTREAIVALLSQLIDLPTVTIADRPLVRWALDRYAHRGDFADLLHLAASGPAASFATFDAGIVQSVGPDTPVQIETLT